MRIFIIVFCCFLSINSVALENNNWDLFALCYHDVRDDVLSDLDKDTMAVSSRHLLEHFEWLRINQYQPVSFAQVEAAWKGEKPLPEKAVLLTFDDGYASGYHRVLPLLKLYNYPAVFALVGQWMSVPAGEMVTYGKEKKPREDFLTWEQVKEMQASGLVEIASHSFNSHQGVIANPQGNTQAALVTHRFSDTGYETKAQYKKRISDDLQKSAKIIKENTGIQPTIMVWPYGRYSEVTESIANDVGMPWSFVLDNGKNIAGDINRIHRQLIDHNPDAGALKNMLEPYPLKKVTRVAHVDLDYLYDEDPKQQSKNLDVLLERIKALGVNTVFLQAYADGDGDGNADALYFPNQYLPVKADIFNRVAWQLQTRSHVEVYAWMPVSAFWLGEDIYQELGVKMLKNGEVIPSDNNYKRLSIFNPKAKKIINSIYSDLARYAAIDGVLFHDDGLLTDTEGVTTDALAWFATKGLVVNSPSELKNEKNSQRWSKLKTEALLEFTDELTATVKHYRPEIKTARNMYAMPVLNPVSEEWFAQNPEAWLNHYDYIAVMAMPFMEKASDANEWLVKLITAFKGREIPFKKIIFELQSKDWHKQKDVPENVLAEQMEILRLHQALNYGYYPDDFIKGYPRKDAIFPFVSLDDYHYPRP